MKARDAHTTEELQEYYRGRSLTYSELRVVRAIATGLTNGAAASALCLAENTVKAHVRRAMAKTGCGTRTELVLYAHRRGLIGPADTQKAEWRATARDLLYADDGRVHATWRRLMELMRRGVLTGDDAVWLQAVKGLLLEVADTGGREDTL